MRISRTMGTGRRRALLIAVPGQPRLERAAQTKGEFVPLVFAPRDAERLRTALIGSGYADEMVTVLDTEDDTTKSNIADRLGQFLSSCASEDIGVVYFSGHGVRIDGTDYLVPSDAAPDYADPDAPLLNPDTLIGVVPDDLLRALTSDATLLFFFDACRSRSGAPTGFTGMKVGRHRENVLLVNACEPDADALGDEERGSVMAQALAEALRPESSARTVDQVVRHVTDRAHVIAESYTYQEPPAVTHRWLGLEHRRSEHGTVEICEGTPYADAWTRAVDGSALWQITSGGHVQQAQVKEQLAALIDKVVAIRRLRSSSRDPWDDELYPQRVVKQLDRLLAGHGRLSLLETTTLLAAPFLREAAIACGLYALHLADGACRAEDTPPSPPREGFGADLDRDMADVRRAYRQIESHRRTLLRREKESDAIAVEHWLRHRFLADWDLLWVEGPAEFSSLWEAIRLFFEAAGKAVGTLREHHRLMLDHALLQVVSQMSTAPGDAAPGGEPWDDSLTEQLYGEERWTWRPKELATLLHVGSLLAIDTRMLDGVITDHLGATLNRVTPEEIVTEVHGNDGFVPAAAAGDPFAATAPADSEAMTDRWVLRFHSRHAAVFTALDRLAAVVAQAGRKYRRTSGKLRTGDLLYGMPEMVKTDGLHPEAKAFDRPPPRFQLAEDEVKPLIMGTRLYGDRMLAVRELYQNALDACRVRHARRLYAAYEKTDGAPGRSLREDLTDFQVTFTQGTDKANRKYIECRDNGVGMTGEELRDLFARAGRRAEQSQTRVREMRRWRRKGIEPELNSRFGIGVFSYFMLADEIEVTTRPVDLYGRSNSGKCHRAVVTAGSGLMHIEEKPADLEGGGTIVKLYVRDEDEEDDESRDGPSQAQRSSLVHALREALWCAPLLVTAQENDGEPVTWQPGELYGNVAHDGQPIPAHDDVWWVQGQGMLLSDGLLISRDQRLYGYVLNLRRRHRPRLSVDRNRLLHYDEAAVREDLQAALPTLTTCPWGPIPMRWLWSMTAEHRSFALALVGHLLRQDASVVITDTELLDPGAAAPEIPLRTMGCLPSDSELHQRSPATHSPYSDDSPAGIFHQSFTAWRARRTGQDHRDGTPDAAAGPASYPAPVALDAVVFNRVGPGWEDLLFAAHSTGISLRRLVRAVRRYAVTGVHVPEAVDLRHLDNVGPSLELSSLYGLFTNGLFGQDAGSSEPIATEQLRDLVLNQSLEGRQPLGELLRQWEELSLIDPRIPRPGAHPGDLAEHVVEASELQALVGRQMGRGTGPPARPFPSLVTPLDIVLRAWQTSMSTTEVESVLHRFAPLGFRPAGASHAAPPAQWNLADLCTGLTTGAVLVADVTLFHLARISAKHGQTMGHVAGRLSPVAAALGLPVAEPGELASVVAPTWFGALSHRECAGASAWEVLTAITDTEQSRVTKRTEPAEGDPSALQLFADHGLLTESGLRAARLRPSDVLGGFPRNLSTDWWTLTGAGVTQAFPISPERRSDRVELPYLIGLAAQASRTLGRTADELRMAVAPFGLEVARVPEEATGLRPDLAVYYALIQPHEVRWKERLTGTDLRIFAQASRIPVHRAAALLHAYRPLGAPGLPVPADAALPDDGDDVPEQEVWEALPPQALHDSWILSPLSLVMTAARLDTDVRTAYRRLLRFRCIGVDIPFAEPSTTRKPDWRDVIILTTRFTGREPALCGDVSDSHLVLAREETELTAAEVRQRLQDYAELFGLRLPPEPSPTTGSGASDHAGP